MVCKAWKHPGAWKLFQRDSIFLPAVTSQLCIMKGQWSFFTSYLLNALQRRKLGFGIRCGRRVQKTHLGRSSISSLELLYVCHSLAMLFQVVVLLVSEGPFEQNSFRFSGCAHWNGPEGSSKPTFAGRKRQLSGGPSAEPQDRAELLSTSASHNA